MTRTLLHAASLALFTSAALIGTTAAAKAQSPGISDHPWIGTNAPAFHLEQVDGAPVDLEELLGETGS